MAKPIDLSRLKVFPLAERTSLTRADDILIDPASPPAAISETNADRVKDCAARIRAARDRDAAVILIYGAHLLRNGAAAILERMMARGWLTHLATNGAGTIHDWEYAWFGASTESVEMGVAGGCFGTWHETATNIHLAILAGALVGYLLDLWLGTEPWLVITGIVLGSYSGFMRIWALIKEQDGPARDR